MENLIAGLKEELASVDYSKFDQKQVDNLQHKLEQSESKMESLFTEWAELEAKL